MINVKKFLKLIQRRKLPEQQQVRRRTSKGRFTALKMLIIPKLNHLSLALPMPNYNFLKDLESEMFEFLWNSKIHKVKRETVIQSYKYWKFITALKPVWITRILYSNSK